MPSPGVSETAGGWGHLLGLGPDGVAPCTATGGAHSRAQFFRRVARFERAGEQMEDLRDFDAGDFVEALFQETQPSKN